MLANNIDILIKKKPLKMITSPIKAYCNKNYKLNIHTSYYFRKVKTPFILDPIKDHESSLVTN